MEYLNKLYNIFNHRVFLYLPQSAKVSWITFVNYERSKFFNKERSLVLHPYAINDVNTEELNFYKITKKIMDKDMSYTLYKLTELMERQKKQKLIDYYNSLIDSLSKSYDNIMNILNNNINQSSLKDINRLGVCDKKILQLSENERKDLVIESFFSNGKYIDLMKSNIMKLLVIAVLFLITVIFAK